MKNTAEQKNVMSAWSRSISLPSREGGERLEPQGKERVNGIDSQCSGWIGRCFVAGG